MKIMMMIMIIIIAINNTNNNIYIYPLIVDLPIKHGGSFRSLFYVYHDMYIK